MMIMSDWVSDVDDDGAVAAPDDDGWCIIHDVWLATFDSWSTIYDWWLMIDEEWR